MEAPNIDRRLPDGGQEALVHLSIGGLNLRIAHAQFIDGNSVELLSEAPQCGIAVSPHGLYNTLHAAVLLFRAVFNLPL
ncbi:hypothetical protein D3C87_1987590 [compost metagenome]